MNITKKFQEIINIQKSNSDEPIGTLNNPISSNVIQKIENLLEEQLPTEIKELYSFADGQNDDGKGILFSEHFCNTDEIVRHLEFSRTLIKLENKSIENPEQSANLINKIVEFYVSKATEYKLSGLQKSWYKMEFECGVDSYSGPYLYATKETTSKEREIIKISDYKPISGIIEELHTLEEKSYKWDELNFVIFADGTFKVERTNYDFEQEIALTSTPENAIKKKYFHYKWLPVFSDFGGNYIGIDLDPDSKGTKGQVINFGRDEQDMVVLAENLDNLFAKILAELKNVENCLLNSEIHLHETLKDMAKK